MVGNNFFSQLRYLLLLIYN